MSYLPFWGSEILSGRYGGREGGRKWGGGGVGAKRPVDIKWGKSEWPKWFW